MTHYYSEKQTSTSNEFTITARHKKGEFVFLSDSGVFSKNRLDIASKLLIETAIVKDKDKVLDIGCGIGVIGISLAKSNKINLTLSDVNERALLLTNKNLKNLKVKGKVIKSHLFENIKDKFDVIVSNPPMAAGRKLNFELIEKSYEHLNSSGLLHLTARHNKGGKALSEKMMEVFGNVETLVKSAGFRVYMSKKVV